MGKLSTRVVTQVSKIRKFTLLNCACAWLFQVSVATNLHCTPLWTSSLFPKGILGFERMEPARCRGKLSWFGRSFNNKVLFAAAAVKKLGNSINQQCPVVGMTIPFPVTSSCVCWTPRRPESTPTGSVQQRQATVDSDHGDVRRTSTYEVKEQRKCSRGVEWCVCQSSTGCGSVTIGYLIVRVTLVRNKLFTDERGFWVLRILRGRTGVSGPCQCK